MKECVGYGKQKKMERACPFHFLNLDNPLLTLYVEKTITNFMLYEKK